MLNKIHSFQDKKISRIIANIAFYLALAIEILIVIVDKSSLINPFEGRLFQITFLLCLIKVVLTKYDIREYIVIFLFCLFGLWIDQAADRNEILRMVMFVSALKGLDIRKVLKAVFWETLAGSLGIILLSITGIYGEVSVAKEYVGGVFENTYAFGMGNANSFHCMFFAIVLLGIYIYEKNMKWWGYTCLVVGDVLLYLLTASKTATAMSALAIIAMAVTKYLKIGSASKNVGGKLSRWILKIASGLCFVLYLFSIGFSLFMAKEAWKIYEYKWSRLTETHYLNRLIKLDNMLTGRMSTLMNKDNRAGSMGSWNWFPVRNHEEFFDLGYVRIFYWYGIIPAIIILLIIAVLLIYLFKKQKYTEIVFLTLILAYTVLEAHFVSEYIGRCYPLLIMGMCWKDEQNR